MRNKFIIGIIIVAAIAGAIGFWYYQRNIYSKEDLKLEILGPEEAELAQEIEYTVKYKNNGNIRLEEPSLVFEFPEYTILEEGKPQIQEILLKDIYPGQEKTFHFKGRLLGKKGEVKKARAWLSYRPKNLNASYRSETSHSTQLKSVPLNLEFDLPSKVESGKEITFRLNYFSNTDYPLPDLGIKIEYPPDFEFKSADPQPLETAEWELGPFLNKAEGGRIEIEGIIRGEVEEQKKFKAQLGSWQQGEFVLLKEAVRAVQIVTPSLYISQQINRNPQYIASLGDTLHYEIFFKNIGQEPFNSLFLVVNLQGELFDLQTLKAPLGDFELGDNSIIFDWRRVSKLHFLNAQEEGKVEFWVELKKDRLPSNLQDKNPVIKNKVILSQAWREFVTKVNSKLEVVQKGYYRDEVFGNSGPLPPEAGNRTTYTIIWQAKNYYNDVKNMKVRATLGEGVSLTGSIFPEGTALTFDSQSREVVWKLDNLAAGKGVLGPGPNVSFQIEFLPKTSQKGKTPELIGKAQISGEDQWTGQTLEAEAPAIDTTLPDDDSVSSEEGIVQ
jgi:hypothetical protein